ncbi:hypothetical protein AWE51_21720 [Aquimarina aggregata]|uniref:BlaR1 peptidase M56 n=1 Tax=Aquimarina aggregata TaxID=1642818 RepID=A0A163BEY9_9FLAO|nr:M56 family metallopeptidase [Aquimarina aggregata]KZS41325.1 hypothetical protein AWE51_21720 [Aquimarina aggregata]
MMHYILQVLAFQLLFLIIYDVFLKKETFFNYNRAYILITVLLSFILPTLKITAIQQNIPEEYIVQLPALLIGNPDTTTQSLVPETTSFFTILIEVITYLWYFGMFISLLLFSYKFQKILKLKKSGIKGKVDDLNVVFLPNTHAAFSFFTTIFLGERISEIKKTNILLHEKVHVSEYHSLDLIFFEILRIIFWFNPLVYIYQNRMAVLQEYIADSKAVSKTDKAAYYQDLLSQIFQTDKISFINTFFNHSLIKNRILMLQKSKSKKVFQLKYLLLIPVIGVMLTYTSCNQENNSPEDISVKRALDAKGELTQRAYDLIKVVENEGEYSEESRTLFRQLMTDVGNTDEKALSNEDRSVFQTLIQKISEVKKTNQKGSDGVPFIKLDKAPVHPSCTNVNEDEAKACFTQNIRQFVNQEFNTSLGKELGLSGQQRIYVRFKIDTTGKIVDVQARGPETALETEAIRVIEKLPNMTPGIKDGVDVAVLYSLPIVFDIK